MATWIQDPEVEPRLRSERAVAGAGRYDEVGGGVYMMAPLPNDEHQQIVSRFVSVLGAIIGRPGQGNVRPDCCWLIASHGTWNHIICKAIA